MHMQKFLFMRVLHPIPDRMEHKNPSKNLNGF